LAGRKKILVEGVCPLVGQKGDAMRDAIGLLLADDSDVIRRAVAQMLQAQTGVRIIGEARSFAEIFRMVADLKPTVVLMDLHMPDDREINPTLVKTRLQLSTKHVLAMSFWNDEQSKALAESYGASTLLDKSTLASELIPAIMQFS
jgi:DNA-binding NarL/FixJ family response regulator